MGLPESPKSSSRRLRDVFGGSDRHLPDPAGWKGSPQTFAVVDALQLIDR